MFFDDSEELDDSIAPRMPIALISCNIMSRTFVDKASTSAAVSPSVGIGSNTTIYRQLDALQAYKKGENTANIDCSTFKTHSLQMEDMRVITNNNRDDRYTSLDRQMECSTLEWKKVGLRKVGSSPFWEDKDRLLYRTD